MQIYLYKNVKISFLHEFFFFFRSILNLNWFKTLIFANYRKKPSKWLIFTTKIIEKFAILSGVLDVDEREKKFE